METVVILVFLLLLLLFMVSGTLSGNTTHREVSQYTDECLTEKYFELSAARDTKDKKRFDELLLEAVVSEMKLRNLI